MKVNGIETYDESEITELWPQGRKPTFQKIKELAEQGYVFVVNNSQNFGYTAKWEPYQPLRVVQATSGKDRRVLWAIKPEPTENLDDYYNNVAWR